MNTNQAPLTGKVKWFDTKKGFGFIEGSSSSCGQDIFLHHKNAVKSGAEFIEFVQGQRVTFWLEKSQKGYRAVSVAASG